MVEIVTSIVFVSFLTKSIFTHLKKKPKRYLIYILVDIVFYATLILGNHRIGASTAVESIWVIVFLIILPIKLWCYKKSH